MAQTRCPMVLQEGPITGAGEVPEKVSRKVSRCRTHLHGQELRRGQCVCMNAKLLQLCPTLSDAMDHSLSGSSVHEILQARILEWVAMPSSRRSS